VPPPSCPVLPGAAMPTLLEVQTEFADALLGGESEDAVRHIADDRSIAAAARMNVYRNTGRGTLIAALRIAYPAVERLVGAEFFEGAAADFVASNPARGAYLNEYGAEFAEFLAGFAPAAGLAYLPDVARLEWAVSCAANAPDAAPLDPAALTELDEAAQERIRFVPHPSVRLLRIGHDADAIRRAVLERNETELAALAPKPDAFWLIVHRTGLDVVTRRLGDDEARVALGLFGGGTLGSILSPDGIDAQVAQLAEHLANGRFAGFEFAAD